MSAAEWRRRSHAQIPPQQVRVRLDLFGRPLVHDMTVVDDVGARGERQRRGEVLFDEDDRLPFAPRACGTTFIRSRTMTGARPSNGSSSRMIFGSRTSARAIASICCSPPERSVPRLPRRSARRGKIS